MTKRPAIPPPLTVAASLTAIQGMVLVILAGVEIVNVNKDRLSIGVTTSAFFLAYGAVLLFAAYALTRRQGWARGPVLITQLIQLGLAWNLRSFALIAVVMAVSAVVVIAGMLNAASVEALSDEPI
ncbi:hypothetical protein GCM10027020_19100 [Nocardioides salsibiostraticola]